MILDKYEFIFFIKHKMIVSESNKKYIKQFMIDLVQSLINKVKGKEKQLRDEARKPLMILGPSAVGKDTMINRLKKKYPNVVNKLPSYTTRPKREGEIEGVDYYFVTKEEFQIMRDKGCLFGIQEYNKNYYASNRDKLKEVMANKNRIIILNFNIETANSVKEVMDFNYVAILPPSEGELQKRLIKRGTKEEEIKKRMQNSIREMQLINEANYIKFRMINDDEETAFKKLEDQLKRWYPFLQEEKMKE